MDFYVETPNGRIGTGLPATGDTEELQLDSSSGSAVPGEQASERAAFVELSESVERSHESISAEADTVDKRDGVQESGRDDSVQLDSSEYQFTETFNPYNWGMGRTKVDLRRQTTNFGNWFPKLLTFSNRRDILREQFPIIRRARANLWYCVVGDHVVETGPFFECWTAAGLPHWVEHTNPTFSGFSIAADLWVSGELNTGKAYSYDYFVVDLSQRDSWWNIIRRVRAQRKVTWEL